MLVLLASLATMCAIQTFDFMENPDRYVNLIWECINYIVISLYLLRSSRMRDRFGQIASLRGTSIAIPNWSIGGFCLNL